MVTRQHVARASRRRHAAERDPLARELKIARPRGPGRVQAPHERGTWLTGFETQGPRGQSPQCGVHLSKRTSGGNPAAAGCCSQTAAGCMRSVVNPLVKALFCSRAGAFIHSTACRCTSRLEFTQASVVQMTDQPLPKRRGVNRKPPRTGGDEPHVASSPAATGPTTPQARGDRPDTSGYDPRDPARGDPSLDVHTSSLSNSHPGGNRPSVHPTAPPRPQPHRGSTGSGDRVLYQSTPAGEAMTTPRTRGDRPMAIPPLSPRPSPAPPRLQRGIDPE